MQNAGQERERDIKRERERERDINRERERERETITKESVILLSAVSQDTEGNKINLFLFCSGLKIASYRSYFVCH